MEADPDPPTLDAEVLREQYRVAVEEYRFQVELNRKRSQDFFALCAAVLAAAFALLASSDGLPRGLLAVPFLLTTIIAGFAVLVSVAQHRYYRAARDHMQRLARKSGLGDVALVSTPGMGGLARHAVPRVTTVQRVVFGTTGAAGVVGAVVAITGGPA